MKLAIFLAKLISFISKVLHLGSGATWPGEILLKINPKAFSYFLSKFEEGVIVIAGTNGKTTTSAMISLLLENNKINGNTIVRNKTGANLLNGLVSACINATSIFSASPFEWGVFEVDENTLPSVIFNYPINPASPAGRQLSNKPKLILVLLNLFRDQLDRYGEVDTVARKWEAAIKMLPSHATLILNADDPQIAYLGKDTKHRVVYFGVEQKEKYLKIKEHATDSTYCPVCRSPLVYEGVYFSHIGVWKCNNCGFERPHVEKVSMVSHLPGLYSLYNLYAAYLAGKTVGIPAGNIETTLVNFKPAFGRQEEIEYNGRKIKIFLSKNPAGFNASLRAVLDLAPRAILLVLNDRIPDGRDVSWIYDVDFELIPEKVSVICSGDRVYDLGVRIKYSRDNMEQITNNQKQHLFEKLDDAIEYGTNKIEKNDTLYVMATYSGMLDVRKILTGNKIL